MQILIYAQQLGNDAMVGWRGYFEDILGQVKKIKTAMFTKTIIYGIIYPNETVVRADRGLSIFKKLLMSYSLFEKKWQKGGRFVLYNKMIFTFGYVRRCL